jgi:triosephosphate isomerase
MPERKPLMAGNWKMNLSLDESAELVKAIGRAAADLKNIEVLVAPPFTALSVVKEAIGKAPILLAGQNMHWASEGAFTGEISSGMLLESGCTHVILGHSERRSLFGETDDMIAGKVESALEAGLIPIACIGETLDERESGRTFDVVQGQLEGSLKPLREHGSIPVSAVLAYEPVWAIGTGKTATPEQAQEVHRFIRQWIRENFDANTADAVRILYGGSVKPENIKDLMSKPDIDGALVGGASLKSATFIPIMRFEESSA